MQSFKLNKEEEEALYRASISLNREMVRIGKIPLTESKIMHKILRQTLMLGEIEVTRNGEIRVLSQSEINKKEHE